jgi:hypothetical protein
MRKLFIICCSLFLLCLKPQTINAHIAGQPPFFLINGTYTGFYPVYISSLSSFNLPQDIAPENYLINQSLNFEIDSAMLPFPQSVIDKTTFNWDFGDGSNAEGLAAEHTYKKMGSFLLTITANYHGYSDPNAKPILQAILLNIVPNKDYKLPQARIKIDHTIIKDPNNPVEISENPVTFDAALSTQGSAKIVSYFWDIGDGESTTQPSFQHTYTDSTKTYIFPMLRIKDANGFISDTFVQLNMSLPQSSQKSSISPLLIVGLVNILFIGGIILFLKR